MRLLWIGWFGSGRYGSRRSGINKADKVQMLCVGTVRKRLNTADMDSLGISKLGGGKDSPL